MAGIVDAVPADLGTLCPASNGAEIVEPKDHEAYVGPWRTARCTPR